jgi:hypothetical protein
LSDDGAPLRALTLSFTVRKRLNMFKTSVRVIKVDYARRQIRNETIHGRVRKTFPFLQVLGTKPVFDKPTQLRISFLKFGCQVCSQRLRCMYLFRCKL